MAARTAPRTPPHPLVPILEDWATRVVRDCDRLGHAPYQVRQVLRWVFQVLWKLDPEAYQPLADEAEDY
jgi:hypothetical protein